MKSGASVVCICPTMNQLENLATHFYHGGFIDSDCVKHLSENRGEGRENTSIDENDRAYYLLRFCKKSFEIGAVFSSREFLFSCPIKIYLIPFSSKNTLPMTDHGEFFKCLITHMKNIYWSSRELCRV